jgi:hypothetical protein
MAKQNSRQFDELFSVRINVWREKTFDKMLPELKQDTSDTKDLDTKLEE